MSFKDVIGQEKAVSILLRTIRRGRVPSSYIFAGESGIGKKLAALNLAKALNCVGRERSPENMGLLDDAASHSGGPDSEIDRLRSVFLVPENRQGYSSGFPHDCP